MLRASIACAAAAVLGFAAAGCGGGESCEDAVGHAAKIMGMGGEGYGAMRAQGIKTCKDERWSPSLRRCLIAAKDAAQMASCEHLAKAQAPGGAVEEYRQKSKRTEAELNLNALLKSAKVHYIEQAQYPKGKAGLTPAAPCCEGPHHKCAVSRDQWTSDPIWSALDFEQVDPGYFQYAYESDGNQLTAIARGDLDCDGTFVEYKLTCTATDGNPQCTIQPPDTQD
jgi:hypothetical protein